MKRKRGKSLNPELDCISFRMYGEHDMVYQWDVVLSYEWYIRNVHCRWCSRRFYSRKLGWFLQSCSSHENDFVGRRTGHKWLFQVNDNWYCPCNVDMIPNKNLKRLKLASAKIGNIT